jgi:hypothetical protein
MVDESNSDFADSAYMTTAIKNLLSVIAPGYPVTDQTKINIVLDGEWL